MTTHPLHPNDKLAALDWAISQARRAAKHGTWGTQTVLAALQQMRNELQREAGNG